MKWLARKFLISLNIKLKNSRRDFINLASIGFNIKKEEEKRRFYYKIVYSDILNFNVGICENNEKSHL